MSNKWLAFDYLASRWDQIVECFLAFNNFTPR